MGWASPFPHSKKKRGETLRRVFSLKKRTINKSQIHIFIDNGKWAKDGLKMRGLLFQPDVLCLGEGKLRLDEGKLCLDEGMLRLSEPEAHVCRMLLLPHGEGSSSQL